MPVQQENKENYIKEIYKLGGAEKKVSNKNVAQVLKVTAASVTEMIIKLQKENIVNYEPYKGSQLTPFGVKMALSLLRGHRLWEVFLIRHLGYKLSAAHEDAELLEHVSSQRLIEALDRFLYYPAYCPHGTPIPTASGQLEVMNLCLLSQLKIGQKGRINQIGEDFELLNYLESLNITLGSTVTILEIGAYEGSWQILVGDNVKNISYKAVANIFVSPLAN